jgi:DNA-binding Lrp family transcriptional regulator
MNNDKGYLCQSVIYDLDLERRLEIKAQECLELMRRLKDRGVLSEYSVHNGRDVLTIKTDTRPHTSDIEKILTYW